MSIALPEQVESYIQGLVEAGEYSRPEEVILEALQEHRARREKMQVTMTPELELLLDDGLEGWEHAVSTDDLRRK
jgi:putative addiction module CopG family antidote